MSTLFYLGRRKYQKDLFFSRLSPGFTRPCQKGPKGGGTPHGGLHFQQKVWNSILDIHCHIHPLSFPSSWKI